VASVNEKIPILTLSLKVANAKKSSNLRMKIQLASDLHLDLIQRKWPGERLIDPIPDADILVLAGDIADGTRVFNLFAKWPVPILFVPGNHEFYEQSEPSMREKMRDSASSGIQLLDNSSTEMGGVRFLGTTLWTDYLLNKDYTQSQSMEIAQRGLNDHALIRCGGARFSARDALDRHEEARVWLTSELEKPWAGKTVVVSHHAPHPNSVHPRFAKDPLTTAFVSDLSELVDKADLWLHGHVHDGFDYQVGRCRVVANPAGYVLNRGSATSKAGFQYENKLFNKTLIEI